MSDEGFREIQLNGKQLVFLFMAATVVLVVTFLFGIMVGRGVPGTEPASETANADVSPDPTREPPVETPPANPPPSSSAETPAAPPAPENLTYTDRLLREGQADDRLKEAKPAAQSKPSAKPPPPPAPAPPTPAPAPVAAAPAPARGQPPTTQTPQTPRPAGAAASDPSGPGFAVQVAISKDRREADTLARALIAKGYPAFVMDPAKGAPVGIYRVRVGKYKTRRDAEEIAARLKTAEQFDPWIAR